MLIPFFLSLTAIFSDDLTPLVMCFTYQIFKILLKQLESSSKRGFRYIDTIITFYMYRSDHHDRERTTQ